MQEKTNKCLDNKVRNVVALDDEEEFSESVSEFMDHIFPAIWTRTGKGMELVERVTNELLNGMFQ